VRARVRAREILREYFVPVWYYGDYDHINGAEGRTRGLRLKRNLLVLALLAHWYLVNGPHSQLTPRLPPVVELAPAKESAQCSTVQYNTVTVLRI